MRSRVLLATVCTVGALVVIEGEALVALPAPSPLELAEMNKVHLAAGDKKAGIDAPWQKIKVDRQIIAIAKVTGAKTIYTNDASLKATAESAGLKVIGVHELPLPVKEDDGQHNFLEHSAADKLMERLAKTKPEPRTSTRKPE